MPFILCDNHCSRGGNRTVNRIDYHVKWRYQTDSRHRFLTGRTDHRCCKQCDHADTKLVKSKQHQHCKYLLTGKIFPFLCMLCDTEKQGECIRFLRSYYRPACKMSLCKIGIFGIILAALLMCDKEAIEV